MPYLYDPCTLCDVTGEYLYKFRSGWVCDQCVRAYGLWNHPFLGTMPIYTPVRLFEVFSDGLADGANGVFQAPSPLFNRVRVTVNLEGD